MKIDIVIVNWNSGSQLSDCLDSIEAFGAPYVEKVIVVDNGSSDGSAQTATQRAGTKLVEAKENLGFGRACNLGAHHTTSSFILFLNPDASLFAGTLERCAAHIDNSANDRIGIFGVQLLDEHGRVARSCARFADPSGFVLSSIGMGALFPSMSLHMNDWDHLKCRVVDHVIGAFFLVRTEVFGLLNGFDERFFVYLEDLDFSYRAKQLGWASQYLADAQAFHAGGGTSRHIKAQRLFYSLRSRLLYANKHFSAAGAAAVWLATLFVEPWSRSALALARRSVHSLRDTWIAYGMLLRWLPQGFSTFQ